MFADNESTRTMRQRLRDLTTRLMGNRRAAESEAPTDVPCVPCQQKKGVRQFSLNAPSVPPMADDFVPILDAQMDFAVIEGQVVLHDPARDASHVLNPGAAIVWATIDDELNTAELIARVARDTGEPVETIDTDVRMALAHFLSAGIVLPAPSTEPTPPAHDLAALEHEAGHLAREARRGAAHARIALVLERQRWCPDIGPRQAAGVPVLVRTNDPAIAGHLNDVLASLPATSKADITISVVDRGRDGAGRYRVIIDNEILFRLPSPEEAADSVLTQLNLLAIGHTPDKLLFHGGAVERNGLVVTVLGPSGLGKSTLTAALVQRGWGYLSDELVTVDPSSLRVEPYPKALDLSDESLELLDSPDALPPFPPGKRQVPPTSLGSLSTGGRLGLVVMLSDVTSSDASDDRWDATGEHDDGDRRPDAVRLATIDSLQTLMVNTFRETMLLPEALAHLAQLCSSVPIISLTRTDIDRSCALIEQAADSATHALVDHQTGR